MKGVLNGFTVFLLFIVMLTSCSSDDKNPPTAGFSVSDNNPTQWDLVLITDTAQKASDVSYTVTGGEYDLADDNSRIVFLEDATYTVTQKVTNSDGSDTFSVTVTVTAPDNRYTLDGTSYEIFDAPVWKEASPVLQTPDMFEFISDVAGQDHPNYIQISPIVAKSFEGTFTYAPKVADGETPERGTYYTRVIGEYDSLTSSSEWITDLNGLYGGGNLVVLKVYDDPEDSSNRIYDININNYTLSTGYFDWLTASFVETGKKTFSISYRGVVRMERN